VIPREQFYIKLLICNTVILVAVRFAEETGKLIDKHAAPRIAAKTNGITMPSDKFTQLALILLPEQTLRTACAS
jgi:hypothetical protein